MEKKICKKCGAENPAGYLLCKNCGEELYKYKSSVTVESAEPKSKIETGIVGIVGWVVFFISLAALVISNICIEDIENRMEDVVDEMKGQSSPEELQESAKEIQELAEASKDIGRMFRWSIVGCLIGLLIIIKQMHVRNAE